MDKVNLLRLENWTDITELVAMSIGTDKGLWWADASFGSELWILKQEGKVDGTTAGRVRAMILDCTAWLKNDGLVEKIECTAERIGKNEIQYCLTVYKPSGQTIKLKDVWHGIG
ncbi:MAG: phage GP46 family protein [Treponemataceae bacterium]